MVTILMEPGSIIADKKEESKRRSQMAITLMAHFTMAKSGLAMAKKLIRMAKFMKAAGRMVGGIEARSNLLMRTETRLNLSTDMIRDSLDKGKNH